MLMPKYDVETQQQYWLTDNLLTVLHEANKLSFIPSYADLVENIETAQVILVPEG